MSTARSRRAAFVCGIALALAAQAQGLVPIPPLTTRVNDLTGTLTAQQAADLERQLAAFEARKGSQIAVLIVPTTQPEAIEQYAIRVADQWKVGRKNVDDGLIVVVAKGDRKLRIEVGYGLEGAVPDAIASRVIREVIAPRFQADDYYGGLDAGTKALMRLVEGEQLPAPSWPPPGAGPRPDLESLLVTLLVVIVVAGSILTKVLGRFAGSAATGGVAGWLVKFIVGSMAAGVVAGLLAFVFTLLIGAVGRGVAGGRRGGSGRGPW
ncbi:MAG: TPM domain-containing protein, partial [Burkholderiales bacterium]